jgi:thiol-disulfide isomerase/thioredoxin
MPRSAILLALSAAAVAAGAIALESAGGAAAQSRNPLTGAKESGARPAPAWHNESWLNADHPVALSELRGRVVMLNFWVFTCYNCTNTVPSLVDFDRKYRPQGLTLIGIHTPEFPPYAGEHDKGNVARTLRKYGIEYPNAQDNDNKTWNLYGIRFWPSFVLIDKKGVIRYEGAGEFHVGDGTYRLWESRIRELLAEPYAELEVRTTPAGADTRVTLVAAPGLKVNARLKPALELKDGTVLRFDSPRLTPDSAYFTEPPTAILAGRHEDLEGTLRASVCGVEEQVCRTVGLRLKAKG